MRLTKQRLAPRWIVDENDPREPLRCLHLLARGVWGMVQATDGKELLRVIFRQQKEEGESLITRERANQLAGSDACVVPVNSQEKDLYPKTGKVVAARDSDVVISIDVRRLHRLLGAFIEAYGEDPRSAVVRATMYIDPTDPYRPILFETRTPDDYIQAVVQPMFSRGSTGKEEGPKKGDIPAEFLPRAEWKQRLWKLPVGAEADEH